MATTQNTPLQPWATRARLNNKGLAGRTVKVTNPKAGPPANNRRTASLGMGNVLQRGRERDF